VADNNAFSLGAGIKPSENPHAAALDGNRDDTATIKQALTDAVSEMRARLPSAMPVAPTMAIPVDPMIGDLGDAAGEHVTLPERGDPNAPRAAFQRIGRNRHNRFLTGNLPKAEARRGLVQA
jgi:hypothetical protein